MSETRERVQIEDGPKRCEHALAENSSPTQSASSSCGRPPTTPVLLLAEGRAHGVAVGLTNSARCKGYNHPNSQRGNLGNYSRRASSVVPPRTG
jgi:hypothetical protein